MNNQKAKLGVFVTLNDPTEAMERAARDAEFVEAGGKLRPRVQICTIQELLKGKKPNLPPVYDIISAAAAARKGRSRATGPTPEEMRKSPSFKLPITGGKKKSQAALPLPEPLLVQQAVSKQRRKRN